MSKSDETSGTLQEVFIQLESKEGHNPEKAIRLIERAGGRVLQAFPPYALFALLDPDKISEIEGKAGIQSMHTEQIDEDGVQRASTEMRMAMMAWNEHMRKSQESNKANPLRDLPWDAPGLLPPDPPPEIQEMLRRREREIKSDE